MKETIYQEYAVSTTEILNDTTINKSIYLYIKRVFDFVLSLVGLVVTSPIVLLFVVLIKLESAGPAFFLQERVGLNGRYFRVIKLRSMRVDAEVNGAQWAEKNDPRVTKVGLFIRKTRIDELPQLVNVLIGEMSLIGPRPERPIFTAQFNEEIPGFISRLQVKPGLSGWAQINGGYDITPQEKFLLDRYYINNMGFYLDFIILFKTIHVCFTGKGAR